MKQVMIMLAPATLAACTGASPQYADATTARVAQLVNNTVIEGREQAAFEALEQLGPDAVPYIVGHLNDMRPLPEQSIKLVNHSPTAFEGFRFYGPQVVHDALAAILNQLTGINFIFVYNGGTSDERTRNANQWQQWCAAEYPAKADACYGRF